MEKEKSEDPRLERSALRCNLAGRTNACEDDRGEDRRLAGYKIAEKGHIMSKLFLLIVLAFLADTASAQLPTIEWVFSKPRLLAEQPIDSLKNYSGLFVRDEESKQTIHLDSLRDTTVTRRVRYPDPRSYSFVIHNGIPDNQIRSRSIIVSFNGKPWAKYDSLGAIKDTTYGECSLRSTYKNQLPSKSGAFVAQLVVADLNGKKYRSSKITLPVIYFKQQISLAPKYTRKDPPYLPGRY
jgi:hypothetical protein